MASITIRNLEDDTKHRMKLRAALHGRSMEEEVRDVLRRATAQEDGPGDLAASVRRRLSTAEPHLPAREAMHASGLGLSLSDAVLEAARQLGINASQVCEAHLREVVRRTQARRWRDDHADFIAAYNTTLEADGLPLDEWRSF